MADEVPLDAYTQAIVDEGASRAHRWSGSRLSSVFLGGGTPSLWGADGVQRVLEQVTRWFPQRSSELEVTMECNPAEVSHTLLSTYKDAGVNRLSLGLQSLDDELLPQISRRHSGAQALAALECALGVGFSSVSADLMFGLPGQRANGFQADLRAVAGAGAHHISAYHLTLEDGTAMTRDVRSGRTQLPPEDIQTRMWELIEPTLADFGLRAYEISNYAHPGHHSRHNQGYWQGLAYLGLGAGAHSLELPPNWRSDDARAARFMNAKHPGSYMKRVADQGHAETDSEFLDLSTHLKERMFTGLRQLDGISLAAMADELGVDPALEFKATIDAMCDRRLLQLQGDTLRLTKEGLRFANDVFLAFI